LDVYLVARKDESLVEKWVLMKAVSMVWRRVVMKGEYLVAW
jgi:hypothetical protein